MANNDHDRRQDALEKHSLPGTNQAGKGPGSVERDEQQETPDEEQLREHSLPGTNQAGKGPRPFEKNHPE